jgi:predicted outer membrane protein
MRTERRDGTKWRGVVGIILAVAALCLIGCAAQGRASPTGPQVAPTVTPAPSVKVESAGPATVETKAPTDVSTEAARPTADVAPRIEALGNVVSELKTQLEATQKTVNAQQTALGALDNKVGTIEGDLTTTVQNNDMSERQLKLFQDWLSAGDNRDKDRARTDRIEKAGLAAGILIAAAVDGPPDFKMKLILVGLGVLIFAAVIIFGIL